MTKQKLTEFYETYFGDQVPAKRKFLNYVAFGAPVFSLLATLVNFITKTGTTGLMVCALCTVVCLLILPVTAKAKNLDIPIYIFALGLNFIVLPMLYFTVGGIQSGIPIYFVIAIVFTILLIDNNVISGIIVFLAFVWDFIIIMYDKNHPELAAKFCVMSDNIYLDTFLDFVVVSLCISVIVKLLLINLRKQQEKTDKLLAQMEELAVKDPLTGAYNRRFLIKYLESGIASAKEQNRNMAIVMFDIDKFKRINDDYGHLVGDEVIKALASTLMTSCRDYDIVSRYGGEEFVLVMPGATEETALVRAEQIRETFSKLKITAEIDRPVTISGGVAEIKQSIKKPEDFIAIADDHLYTAKETGRNKIVGTKYNKGANS